MLNSIEANQFRFKNDGGTGNEGAPKDGKQELPEVDNKNRADAEAAVKDFLEKHDPKKK